MKNKSNLFRIAFLFIALGIMGAVSAAVNPAKQVKILVFFETKGFYHSSIPVAVAALQKLGQRQ